MALIKLPKDLPEDELRRRKREGIIILVILLVVAGVTFVLNRIINFGADVPVANAVLMFILINITLLLLILLIYLVFRNLVKLLYDRRRKVMGARLRTRLVIAFVALTLLPTTILFFFAINFITASIQFWFNVPVEQALENSLEVGRFIYQQAENDNRYFLERIAYQINRKKLLAPKQVKALTRYIQIVQREFNLDAIEVYGSNAQRITFALRRSLEDLPLTPLASDELRNSSRPKSAASVITATASGELIRTIATIPFRIKPEKAAGFIVLGHHVPKRLAEKMSIISHGVEGYKQIKLVKQPIQTVYYITLSIVALLVVFCAIWFGFYLAKTISIPLQRLAEGTRRVAEGDLSFALEIQGDDEIGALVEAFNKMTRDLRIGREQIELSAQMLRQQNIEIEERRRYMEIVLKNVSTGVITIDAKGKVTTFNKAAESMLGIRAGAILNKDYKAVLNGPYLKMADEIMEKLSGTGGDTAQVPLRLTISGRPRSFLAYINALKDDSGQHMGIVMVIDDLTELEKAQRMAAWREVARRIAHEVKNPLTPISLSAQRLKRKYSSRINEPVFEECTQMIINHVELIRNLVNEFSAFARFPTADLKPCPLPPLIDETVALYREGHPEINFTVDIEDSLPILNLDRQQIKQALINLIDNAVAALKGVGRIAVVASYDSILKIVRLEVADDGPGISDEDKIRLFEPNFSTKKSGMGLGLTIVNSIVTDHNGMIRVQDNHPCGAKFVIELPVV